MHEHLQHQELARLQYAEILRESARHRVERQEPEHEPVAQRRSYSLAPVRLYALRLIRAAS